MSAAGADISQRHGGGLPKRQPRRELHKVGRAGGQLRGTSPTPAPVSEGVSPTPRRFQIVKDRAALRAPAPAEVDVMNRSHGPHHDRSG